MPREWVSDFLASLSLSPNVAEACREAGITRKTAYDLRKADPSFAEAWDLALDESTDDLVGECYRRARCGVEEPVHYKGERVDTIRKYSDTLAMFLLKAHRRHVYGDKLDNQLSGDVTIRVEYADADLDPPPAASGPESVPEGPEAV